MNEQLVPKTINLCVVKLANSRAIGKFHALILIALNRNLFRPDLIKDSLVNGHE